MTHFLSRRRAPGRPLPAMALCLALLAYPAAAGPSRTPAAGRSASRQAQAGAKPATQVYIGTVHGWSDLIAHPNQWNYVRANADGFYANFIQLLPTVGDPGTLCRQTAPLMTHKNALFESDSRYTGLGGFPNGGQFTLDTEAQEINELLNAGFTVAYSSLNYGVDDAKLKQCRTLGMPAGTMRPCLAQNGPWLFGGDINLNTPDNATVRKDTARTEGASTDGPLQLWITNNGKMQQGSVSVVNYAHGLGKQALVMVSPGDLPAAQWLATAQQCVRYHEDQGAIPDIWADYAYDTQTPTLPETNADGTPANTVTGMAYWLIHHVYDPAHNARLSVSDAPGLMFHSAPMALFTGTRAEMAERGTTPLENLAAGFLLPVTDLGRGRFTATRTVTLTVRNESAWLDLIPVLHADMEAPGQNWAISFRMGGKDITPEVMHQGGYVFAKDQRLWPRAAKTITMTLSCRNPTAHPLPVAVKVGLRAYPGLAGQDTQTITFRAVVPSQSKK